MTDLTQAAATELSSLYQSGAVSPVTVAHQVLAKIERVNSVLNAFCFTDPDTTLKQAQASEQRWRQGQPLSELDGVPVAIKDSILTQGWPTRHASLTVDPDQSWTEDAPAVARLREAGAVFVGKTTMSEFGSSTDNSDSILYGPVHNPWAPDHSPGGSSGGSASAVAAGLVPVALGTDFIGSIAVPSLCCGIFGMRPSTGRVSQYPVDALELSAVGPLARSVDDIALVMNVITNPDVRDGTSLPGNQINYTQIFNNSLHGKKVACVTSQVDTKIIDYLKSQKVQVDFISLDLDLASKILNAWAESKLLHQWKDIPEQRRHLAGRDVQRRAILSHRPEDTNAQLINRHKLITQMRKIMQCYDALIGPAINPDMLSSLSVFFSITKQPTITVPIGLDHRGMPQSVMIAGAMYDDVSVLQMAHAIQSAFPMPACPVIL